MSMVFKTFSAKQMAVLCWWCKGSAHGGHDAIICDGAVRSGKTICMSLSFIAWAFYTFEDTSFAVCGKTIASLRRNVVVPLLPALRAIGFECAEKRSQHLLEISRNGRKNRFYLFGGKDEGSAALIQGMTLGGVLLDEVALMPRSFVEQALARCSLDGSKLWFNCNPENPLHWFHEEWIKKAQQKNCLYLHFTMDDNPSLTERIIQRYKSLYSGAFYERFVEGKWVAAQGLVYPMFKEAAHVREPPDGAPTKHYISCDYGTVNPSSFGLWVFLGHVGTAWRNIITTAAAQASSARMKSIMPRWKNSRGRRRLRRSWWILRRQALWRASAATASSKRSPLKMRCWTVSAECPTHSRSGRLSFAPTVRTACASLDCIAGTTTPQKIPRAKNMTMLWMIYVTLCRR